MCTREFSRSKTCENNRFSRAYHCAERERDARSRRIRRNSLLCFSLSNIFFLNYYFLKFKIKKKNVTKTRALSTFPCVYFCFFCFVCCTARGRHTHRNATHETHARTRVSAPVGVINDCGGGNGYYLFSSSNVLIFSK